MLKGKNPRQVLIAATTFLGGLYFFLEYVLPKSLKIGQRTVEIGAFHDQITTGVQVVGSMAVGLGIINILQVHGHKIMRARAGWINSLALLLGMAVTVGVEVVDLMDSQQSALRRREYDTLISFTKKITADDDNKSRVNSTAIITETKSKLQQLHNSLPHDSEESEVVTARSALAEAIALSIEKLDALSATTLAPQLLVEQKRLEESLLIAAKSAQELAAAERATSPVKKIRGLLEQGFVESLGSAMFALLAFYIANAAYRAFRVRSLEAVVMMSAALIVMLGQIPFGPLYISDRLPTWRLWLIETISTPAFRAIYFGAAIAGLSMAVRMWLSLERSPLTAESDQIGSGGKKK